MDFECRLRGAERLAYPPVVAGQCAALPNTQMFFLSLFQTPTSILVFYFTWMDRLQLRCVVNIQSMSNVRNSVTVLDTRRGSTKRVPLVVGLPQGLIHYLIVVQGWIHFHLMSHLYSSTLPFLPLSNQKPTHFSQSERVMFWVLVLALVHQYFHFCFCLCLHILQLHELKFKLPASPSVQALVGFDPHTV